MPFEATVDSLDTVPDDAKPFYRKAADGKFQLITAESIDKLEGTLGRTKAERDEAKKAAAEVNKWKELGLTPDEIAELRTEKETREHDESVRKGEFEKLKAQMAENHAKELKGKDEAVNRYKTALERKLIDADATAEIAAAKGAPRLLLPEIQRRTKVDEVDGDFIVTVLTPDGKGPQLNDKSQPMTMRELVLSLREDDAFGRAFEGSGHSGGGGSGTGGGGTPKPGGDLRKSAMSVKEKTAFVAAHGPDAFRALPL